MKTVILSRKGFDSSAGGKANWIYSDRLIPIPIPEAGTGIFYDDLTFEDNISFRKVMRELNINQYSEAHPDPFLNEIYKCEKTKTWHPSLGQCGASMSSLDNNGVSKGSIFLFFGWFKRIERKKDKWKYTPIDGHHEDGVHMIYGYLEVKDVIDISENVTKEYPWLENHPHYNLRKNITQYPGQNKIFLAQRAGIFDYSDDLILTEKSKSRSNWKLPQFMVDENIQFSYLGDILNSSIKANFRGQEIIGLSKQERLLAWANSVIETQNIHA